MDHRKLSKKISYALRHAPWEYGLELDENGYVPLCSLLDALNDVCRYEHKITEDDIKYIIDNSDKQRFEINGDKIRALYGHSVPVKISKNRIIPPEILYHGTSHSAVPSIMKDGLRPMKRQYVHLSKDIETAVTVGSRRDRSPVILRIDAKRAHEDGICFYMGNESTILADYVPAKYIAVNQEN